MIKSTLITIIAILVLFTIFIRIIGGNGDMQRGALEGFLSDRTNSNVTIGKLDALYFFPDFVIKMSDVRAVSPEFLMEKSWSAGNVEFRGNIWNILGINNKIRHLKVEDLYISQNHANGKNLHIAEISLEPVTKEVGQISLSGQYGNNDLSATMQVLFHKKEKKVGYFTIGEKPEIKIKNGDHAFRLVPHITHSNGIEINDISIHEIQGKDKKISDIKLEDSNKIASMRLGLFNYLELIELEGDLDGLSFSSDLTYKRKVINPENLEIVHNDILSGNFTFDNIDPWKLTKENSDFNKVKKIISKLLPPKADNNISFGSTDISLKIYADKISQNDVGFANIELPLNIKNNSLSITDISGNISGGNISGNLYLTPSETNAGNNHYSFSNNLNIKQLNFGNLQESLNEDSHAKGYADIKLNLKGEGQSFRDIQLDLDGYASLIAADGELNSSIIDLWGGGLVNALIPSFDDDEAKKLNCIIADFNITDSFAKSEALLIDTPKISVNGSGSINLLNGDIKFKIDPDAKDTSLLDIATSMKISGNITDPQISPDMKSVGKKGIGALLGIVNPALLLITMTDFGLNEDHPCHKFIGEK